MPSSVTADAYAVLLPAFADLRLSGAVRRFLSSGGCSLLLGESRDEYVTRRMSDTRRQQETAGSFCSLVDDARGYCGDLLVAVDQEICGICRLHDLVPAFPQPQALGEMDAADFERVAGEIAAAARSLGVNCFLAPILDRLTGPNPWLQGRTWSADPRTIGSISAAFVRGVQGRGVAATAKHFPGYADIPLDPAIEPGARCSVPLPELEAGYQPYAEAIACGVSLVMTGPAIADALDTENAASLSPAVIGVLRGKLGFEGVILSDDLDAAALLRGASVPAAALQALSAGADLLLLADTGDQLDLVAQTIIQAVATGQLSEERLSQAACKVRALCRQYSG